MSRIGIIAGQGTLPKKLIEACVRDGKDFFVVALKGQADKDLVSKDTPHVWVKLGATNETINILKNERVTSIVMAGSVKRPGVFDLKPDLRTMQIIAEVGAAALGDDKLLKAITDELEKEGFEIIGAHEIEPDVLTPLGNLTNKKPVDSNKSDIEYAIRVAKTIGGLDIGQAAIVQQGVVIGVEAVEGTNELINRYKKNSYKVGHKGVLVKAAKPEQDKRLDLPTIGTTTIKKAYKAGLAGIAVEAGSSIILEREEVIALADKLGLFVIGFETPENED